MQIEAIERQTTADLVVEQMARVIKEQDLSAGQRLPAEHEPVERLKLSRPVLRETLVRLQRMGLANGRWHHQSLPLKLNYSQKSGMP